MSKGVSVTETNNRVDALEERMTKGFEAITSALVGLSNRMGAPVAPAPTPVAPALATAPAPAPAATPAPAAPAPQVVDFAALIQASAHFETKDRFGTPGRVDLHDGFMSFKLSDSAVLLIGRQNGGKFDGNLTITSGGRIVSSTKPGSKEWLALSIIAQNAVAFQTFQASFPAPEPKPAKESAADRRKREMREAMAEMGLIPAAK